MRMPISAATSAVSPINAYAFGFKFIS
jgi:hypothetical protein